jgi:heptosyltransferase I
MLRANEFSMSEVHRILLIKPSSLGDIVHAMPVVAALKDRWPEAQLTWLVKRQWADLVEHIEGVDRIQPMDATLPGWLGQVTALRAERFDLMIDLQGLLRSAAIGWASGVPTRVGFANGREGSPWFYTHRVPVPRVEMHAVDRYLLVAAALGAPSKGMPEFRFKVTDEDLSVVRELLQRRDLSLEKPWVAMNISARWLTKRWPPRAFAAVADQLTKEGLGPIVVIGSALERAEVGELKTLAQHPIIDLTGDIPLGCLPALLSKAALLITNDSGPMHIAAAAGTPVVALFGPTSPARTGPYGASHIVLTHEVPCRPCFKRVCHHFPAMECLEAIAPCEVTQAARRVLTSDLARP